jgi:uncharacterized protein (DUF2235 family)
MSKNIVIFCDGTAQEGGNERDTNIHKMYKMVENRTPRQVAFYSPGLGTNWQKVTGTVGGMGISKKIQECYQFISDHFESGDQIFLVGFSRGAATVRSLSSFIHHFGILPKDRPDLIPRAYRIYKISDEDKRERESKAFVQRYPTMWTRIKFLGCYDTVAALGLPFESASVALDGLPGFRHQFHNFKLSESVEHAYHALAIDDERQTFHPVLWDEEVKDYQTVRQVWFSGMHSDVGGGYKEHQLSDIPLVWMTSNAVKHGLWIYPNRQVQFEQDENGFMNDSRGRGVRKLYRRSIRTWDSTRRDKPIVHASVLQRAKNRNNQDNPPYQPWILEFDYEEEAWLRYENSSEFISKDSPPLEAVG